MSRPIYEPTPPREDARLGFGNDQLFRRPAPISGCQIEYFRAVRYLTPVTVGGTTQITVDWDGWEWCSEVFIPLDQNLNPDPTPGVDQVRRVQLDIVTFPGRYTFMWGAHNTSNIAGSVEMSIHDGDPIWGRPESTVHGAQAVGANSLTVGFYQMTMSRIYPLYDPFGSGLHTPQISFTLAQNGGASENFSELVMEIHYESCVNICPEGSS